jgi:DNA-binding YbaB/EbfC family protein
MNFNPLELMKNAQQIQEKMSGFQEKLELISVTGASGGSMVEIDINGKFEVLAVRIAPQAMEGDDIEMLQDLIMSAFTDGITKVREEINRQMSAITGGLNLSGFPGVM